MRVCDERLAELREKHLRDAARLSRHEVLADPHRDLAALLAELAERRARERETRLEYAVARPASMPDMSGKERWTLIVGSTFPSLERAEEARQRVPSLRDRDAVIVSRIAPGSDWEAVTTDEA